MNETQPKPRKPRSDKGMPRGPRRTTPPPIGDAPIHVRVVLRGRDEAIEFGCGRRIVENGFHVFFYPSQRDRYRETRREFAISEVVEIEITESRPVYDARPVAARSSELELEPPPPAVGPKIHSVRRNMVRANAVLERLETSSGPIKMSSADLSGALGVGAAVGGVGDSG